MTATTHRQIYKLDSTGKTRVWYAESEDNRYRTIAGILGGNLVTSEWTTCEGKQGRTDAEQAQFEVQAAYTHKLTREYHETIEGAASGAHYFKPMLAREYTEYPGRCFVQPKLDGIRCIATRMGLFSRQGKPITAVPHIFDGLQPLFALDPELVLDGELYNHDLKDDFNEIVSLVRKKDPVPRGEELIQYHVYDMPSHPGIFSDRSLSVGRVLHELRCNLSFRRVFTAEVPSTEELERYYAKFLNGGYEGMMVRLDLPYEQKRSKRLLKRKEFQTAEFPIISIDEGEGNWSGVAKSVTCRLPNGETFGAGIKGTRERAAQLLHEKHATATVRFFEYTPDGVPRFPVVIDFHAEERVD